MKRPLLWVCCFAISVIFVAPNLAQEKIRTLKNTETAKDLPLAFTGMHLGKRPFHENKIQADSGWLRDLSLTIKNVSLKTILYVNVNLRIPKQVDMLYPSLVPMRFGTYPRVSVTDTSSSGWPKLQPGESVSIQFQEGVKMAVERRLQQEWVDLESADLVVNMVIFDDGTAWTSGGIWMRQHPDDPTRFYVPGIGDKPTKTNN